MTALKTPLRPTQAQRDYRHYHRWTEEERDIVRVQYDSTRATTERLARYQERMALVAEKEALLTRAQEQLAVLGISTGDFESLLASLPPEVVTERDDLICNYAGRDYMDEMYLWEKLAQLGGKGKAKIRVQETLHKLHLIEAVCGADLELEDALVSLDAVVRQMPAALRKSLEQQAAGQQVLL